LANDLRSHSVYWEWAKAKVVADPPEKLKAGINDRNYQMITDLMPYFDQANEEVIILSPYFVPGKEGVKYLTRLREKGVRVRILTNSLASTDVSIVHAGYARYRKALLRAGVELHELDMHISKEERKSYRKHKVGNSKSSLHAKAFVIDRSTVFIGSMNLDPRSIQQNTEIGVVIHSAGLGAAIAGAYDKNIDKAAFRLELRATASGYEELIWHGIQEGGDSQIFTNEPNTGFWRRFGVFLARLLPIESQI
jgi:putative cardiolipin synthase